MADDNNPFGDTDGDVEAGAYGDNAYAEAAASGAVAAYGKMDDSQKAQVQDYAQEQATNQIASVYDETKADVEQAQSDTAGHNPAPETPGFVEKCTMWLPVRYFAAIGGVLWIAFPVLDFLTGQPSLLDGLVYVYVIAVGIITIFIEFPACRLNRRVQLKVFFWMKILSRVYGRAWFYILMSLLCLSEIDEGNTTFTTFAGFYMIVIAIMMFVVSKTSATKYRRMYEYISAGKEGEERDAQFSAKFDEVDVAGQGSIASADIVVLAQQAGRDLANAELHAIQSFMDDSRNGRVLKGDFIKIFKTYETRINWL